MFISEILFLIVRRCRSPKPTKPRRRQRRNQSEAKSHAGLSKEKEGSEGRRLAMLLALAGVDDLQEPWTWLAMAKHGDVVLGHGGAKQKPSGHDDGND